MESHIEEAVIAFASEIPAYGQLRVSNELKKRGVLFLRVAFGACGNAMTLRPSRSV
jgi:hypothetical protein